MTITERFNNGFRERTRFKLTLIAYMTLLLAAIAKNWFSGISETILGIAAGLVTAYIAGDTFRPSDKESP